MNIKSLRKTTVDPYKIIRIEKLDEDLGLHLFGTAAKNGVHNLVTKEPNYDAIFKVVEKMPCPLSCGSIENYKEQKSCTKKYLKDVFKKFTKGMKFLNYTL